MSKARSRSSVSSARALPGALAIIGCSLFQSPVTMLKSAASIHGRDVQVAFFTPGSLSRDLPGSYVLLRRQAERWQVDQISASPVEVPQDEELLYVAGTEDSPLYVTPVYPANSPIDTSDGLFNCEIPQRGYGPCRSALVTNTPPPLLRAGIDREEIAKALVEASVVEAIEAQQAELQRSRELAQRYRDFCQGASIRVERVANAPGLVRLAAEDVARFISVSAEPEAPALTGQTRVTFRPFPQVYEAARSFGKVRCWFSLDQGQYQFEFPGTGGAPSLPVSATVERCSVLAPRLPGFVAADESGTFRVEMLSFDPEGVTSVTLHNDSDEFTTVSSLSLYYFDKILSPEFQGVELPPHAQTTTPVILRSAFGIDPTLDGVTADNAGRKSFTFGVAAKYKRRGMDATLLDKRELTLSSLLALN